MIKTAQRKDLLRVNNLEKKKEEKREKGRRDGNYAV